MTKQNNQVTVTHQQALESLKNNQSPEAKAILDYVGMIKKKDIAVLGTDEAFVLQDKDGQIKAFKRSLTLSKADGTLVQPVFNGDYVVSAQGYEVIAEATGTTVLLPEKVLVGSEWKSNPHVQYNEKGGIETVHACAISYRFSSMGLPQASSWTTIFDSSAYRMIDLLAKAKKFKQAFKLLPEGMEPEKGENEAWACYPYDEVINVWVNVAHEEVITWLSQILNRQKKAIDFAQSFARRNATKHLLGIQRAPGATWTFPVLAWRPTGNNIVKWDNTQYVEVQKRVSKMIEGGVSEEFTQQIELKQGSAQMSDEENIEALESEVDPEDNPESKPEESQEQKEQPRELSKEVKQALYLAENFPSEFEEACKILGINTRERPTPIHYDDETAVKVCQKIGELVDQQEDQ